MRIAIASLMIVAVASVGVAQPATQFSAWSLSESEHALIKDGVFIPRSLIDSLGLGRGGAVELRAAGGDPVTAFVWPGGDDTKALQISPDLRDALALTGENGTTTIGLRKWTGEGKPPEPSLPPVSVEVLPGDIVRWKGLVVGAPHGDYDARTGEIVEELNRTYKVPAIVAWGARLPSMGRWVDANRPTQRLAGEGSTLREDREWTAAADDVYTRYREALLLATKTSDRIGEVPIDLYVDFHGHALTVRSADGKTIRRNVFECVARGFTRDEVRLLKAALDEALAAELGDKAMPTKWDNLPEETVYTVEGISTPLTFNALGSRVNGTLSSDVSLRAIHIETPNALRTNAATRKKLPAVLARFLAKLHSEIGPASLSRNRKPAPTFPASEPQAGRFARLPSGVEIGITEVTNQEYAAFARKAIAAGAAKLTGGAVVGKNGTTWLEIYPAAPLSLIAAEDSGALAPRAGRSDHPVLNVTWHGADAYAQDLGGRLPTSTEWRAAAQGIKEGSSANYMHGPGAVESGPFPWTAPVGCYPASASAIGCLDMAGNAYEWTADWFESSDGLLFDTEYKPTMKYLRGGAWDTEGRSIAPGFSLQAAPHTAMPNVGFRIARDPK